MTRRNICESRVERFPATFANSAYHVFEGLVEKCISKHPMSADGSRRLRANTWGGVEEREALLSANKREARIDVMSSLLSEVTYC